MHTYGYNPGKLSFIFHRADVVTVTNVGLGQHFILLSLDQMENYLKVSLCEGPRPIRHHANYTFCGTDVLYRQRLIRHGNDPYKDIAAIAIPTHF